MTAIPMATRHSGWDARTPLPYSACGDPELEARIARDLELCVRRVSERLPPTVVEGVVLGGGYGRGEGGARRDGERLVPYNDYDLFAITGPLPWPLSRALGERVSRLADELTKHLDVEVEIALVPKSRLLDPPQTLAMADLRAGHRILRGPADLLATMPGPAADEVPILEATILVMNRTALLAMAHGLLERLGEQEVAERVARYVRKAWLAAGDGWLIAAGRYHPATIERMRRVQEESLPPTLVAGYLAAARERLEGAPPPSPAALPAALATAAEVLRRTLDRIETIRLGVGTADRLVYREAVLDHMPARLKDRLRDLRDCGSMALTLPFRGARLARLLAVLPCVLDHLADPVVSCRACAWLEPSRVVGLSPRHRDELNAVFLRRWRSLP